jgi:hypothetical protein
MNEEIRRLAEQAGFEWLIGLRRNNPIVAGQETTVQEFAELMVRRCAKITQEWYENHEKIHSDPASYLLSHFGIDE